MHLRDPASKPCDGAGRLASRLVGAVLLLAAAAPVTAQEGYLSEGEIDVDFLFNYYQQDGERSPVTGGIGSEEMDVLSPVVAVTWRVNEDWTLTSDVGVDGITSASVDAIDNEVSSASRQDSRAFFTITGTKELSGDRTLSLITGFSNEYDYRSLMVGVGWSKELDQRNTTLSAQLRHYADTIELYDIDGEVQGEDDRTSTDVTLGVSQVLGPKTLLSAELYHSRQSGYLGTPFHEVILQDGTHVTERLPEDRSRTALGVWLNHAFRPGLVGRLHYRFYDDDWGIRAHTVELEPQFKISDRAWIFPILRFHSQTGTEYFGLPGTFVGNEDFFTADGDLADFTSEKYGLGYRTTFAPGRRGWTRRMRSFEVRGSFYSREDGLESWSLGLAWGWRF